MPYTTPYLSRNPSVSLPTTTTAPLALPTHHHDTPTTTATQPRPQPVRAVSGESSASKQSDDDRRPQRPPARNEKPPPPERRRSTLTSRFPLLRKASREVTPAARSVVPAIHIRGTSTASALPPSDKDQRFLSSTEPRASPSSSPRVSVSSARGRNDSQNTDQQPSRHPSNAPSERSASNEDCADNTSVHSTTLLHPSPSPRDTTSDSEPDRSRPSKVARAPERKMHQTSSRLLRMTDDERPFTRDFKDLFSTLMVSLPLTPHRVRFRMIDFTFTSDEAITNLGSLKFSQSNRMPDPKDSSRVVTTTTTTTFSMAKEMARSVCQKFLDAKFIESVESKTDFQSKSSVWQLTPKGIHILERFCSRNGIQSSHVRAVIESNRNPRQLVILERDTETDKLHHDEQTVQIIFRRFVGLNVNETAASDSDSIHEFSKCDVGVRMIKHKPTASQPYDHVFTGKATVDWLMDCCTMVDRREGLEIGGLFLQLGLIAHVDPRNNKSGFIPIKQAQYYVTPHGQQIAGWSATDEAALNAEPSSARARDGSTRDSNSNRTLVIIRNPSWRLLYREFLKETMCEENLSFYLEVQEFNNQYKAAVSSSGDHKIETIRETLAAAYGLYNAFLAPGSPNELNIDHALRTQLATRMTRAVGDDTAMLQSLVEVASLFEKAQNSIFKLMSSDSVPKFVKHPKYGPQLRGLDAVAANTYTAQPSAGSRS